MFENLDHVGNHTNEQSSEGGQHYDVETAFQEMGGFGRF